MSGCPMFGLNQDECCNGEQACQVGREPQAPADRPRGGNRSDSDSTQP